MREFKFRAWHQVAPNSGKSMTYWRLEQGYGNNTDFFDAAFTKRYGVGDIMQYTGLKDKNGKECYFNDLVIIGTSSAVWQVCQDDFGIPSFVAVNAFGLMQTFEEYFIQDINRKRTDFEIIGNVHENPELL